MKKIIHVSTTPSHILAVDSDGIIWWRRWDKRGWNKMEQVPLEENGIPISQAQLSIPIKPIDIDPA